MSRLPSVHLTAAILVLSFLLVLDPIFLLLASGDTGLGDSRSSPSANSVSGNTASVSANTSSAVSVSGDAISQSSGAGEDPGTGDAEPTATPSPELTENPAAEPTQEVTETPAETGQPDPTTDPPAGENDHGGEIPDVTTSPVPDDSEGTQSAVPPTGEPGPTPPLPTLSPAPTTSPEPQKSEDTENETEGDEVRFRDTRSPTLVISGIKDHSSNRKAVTVVVRVVEAHPSSSGIKAVLTGAKRGRVPLTQRIRNEKTGKVYVLGPIRQDDIYVLALSALDRYGNSTEKDISFTVNTKGASFQVLSPEGKVQRKAFYARIRVDDLEEVNVTSATINGEERAYTYRDGVVTFLKKIREEGKYTIRLRTVDAAGNENEMEPCTVTLFYKKKSILDAIRSFLGKRHETGREEAREEESPVRKVQEEEESGDSPDAEEDAGTISFPADRDGEKGLKAKAASSGAGFRGRKKEEKSTGIDTEGRDRNRSQKSGTMEKHSHGGVIALFSGGIIAVLAVFIHRIHRKRRKAS